MLYEQDQVRASESFLYVKRADALARRQTANIIDYVKTAFLGNGII